MLQRYFLLLHLTLAYVKSNRHTLFEGALHSIVHIFLLYLWEVLLYGRTIAPLYLR